MTILNNLKIYANQKWEKIKINGRMIDIPEYWEVEKIGDNIKISTDNFTKEELLKGNKKYYATGSIKNNKLLNPEIINKDNIIDRAKKKVVENSTWIARMKNTNKNIYFKEKKEDIVLSTGMLGLISNKINMKLIYFITNTNYFNIIKNNKCFGTTQLSLNDANAKLIQLSIPSTLQEQNLIALFLTTQEEIIEYFQDYNTNIDKLKIYFQQELLSGRIRIKLKQKYISEAEELGLIETNNELQDYDIIKNKKEDFNKWLNINYEDKIEFYENDDNSWKKVKINGKIIDIPVDWKVEKLRNIEKILICKGEKEGLSPYLEIGDIDNKTKKYLLKNKCTVKGAKFVKKNTLLISTVRPNLEKITKTKEDLYVSSAFATIELTKNNLIYFYTLQKQFTNFLLRNVEGGTYPTVKKEIIYNFQLSIPSTLQEQTLIASFLTKLDNYSDLIKEQIKKEEKLFLFFNQEFLSGRLRIK